jgi:hypothetical protein
MLIYRAYIPGRTQDGVEQCYIGKTIQSLEERKKQHKRSASNKEQKGKSGKLHKTMYVEEDNVKFESIYIAKDAADLAKNERSFVIKYKSKESGWNTVLPSGQYTPKCTINSITYNEKKVEFESYKDLTRVLGKIENVQLSYSTLLFYMQDIDDTDDLQQLEQACLKAVGAANGTTWRERRRNIFGKVVFGKRWVKEILDDSALNKYKLTESQFRSRLDGKDDVETIEEALKKPGINPSRIYHIVLENDDEVGPFNSISSLINELKHVYPNKKFPSVTTIHTYLRRGYSLKQAVGLEPPPWRCTELWSYMDQCLKDGYEMIGKVVSEGQPLESKDFKKVFTSIKNCAGHFNFDYTTLSEKLKEMTLDDYLKEKKRTPRV